MGAAPRFNLSSSSLSFSICASLIAIFFSVELVLPIAKSTSHSIHVYCRRISAQGYSLAILRTPPPFLCISFRGCAIHWQYIVFLDFSMHPSAIPSHRKSPQCITSAGQRDTVHFNAFAQRSTSTQSRSFAARYPSSPFPCVSQHRLPVVPILCLAMPLFAVPLLCKSLRFYAHLSLCQASPRQADLCHRVSSRSRALPLRSQAKRGFTFALRISAILCLC